MSLDWPLGCPPGAHRSRAGHLHQNLPTFCAAPKTPSQWNAHLFPVEASPYSMLMQCDAWYARPCCVVACHTCPSCVVARAARTPALSALARASCAVRAHASFLVHLHAATLRVPMKFGTVINSSREKGNMRKKISLVLSTRVPGACLRTPSWCWCLGAPPFCFCVLLPLRHDPLLA
eukprot:scaffold10353_cov127-Isochrysis_galbana.AAC.12